MLGSFNLTHAAWPHLIASPSARIVLVTSVATFGIPRYVSYGTAKAALIGMTMNLAVEGEPHGILANAVIPLANTRMVLAGGVTQGQLDALRPEDRERQRPWSGSHRSWHSLAHDSSARKRSDLRGRASGGSRASSSRECQGFVKADATIEELQAHWAAVNDQDGYCVPDDATSSITWPKEDDS